MTTSTTSVRSTALSKTVDTPENGVSPWEMVSLTDAADFLDSARKPVKSSDRTAMQGIYPYYGASGIVDYVNDYIFDEDLILLGEDGENILSRSLPLAFKVSGKIWVNNHAHVLRPKPAFDIDYLAAYLESLDFTEYNTGTAQPKLNKASCSKIQIAKPPIAEQKWIARCLNDTASLIITLEELINKKRAIKQGMMQELLTAKTRLAGFSDGWTRQSVRDIVLTPVTDGPHLTPRFLQTGVPFLSVNNLVDGRIDMGDLRYISRTDHAEFSKKCAPRRNDILLGKAASVGKVAFVDTDTEFNIWSPIAMIRVGSGNYSKFVYYQLQSASSTRQISLFTNTSSQGNIGMGDIEKLELDLPPYPEQVAISEILSDVDAEIYLLQERLAKMKTIKQGMMQELLSGRTRLEPKGAAK